MDIGRPNRSAAAVRHIAVFIWQLRPGHPGTVRGCGRRSPHIGIERLQQDANSGGQGEIGIIMRLIAEGCKAKCTKVRNSSSRAIDTTRGAGTIEKVGFRLKAREMTLSDVYRQWTGKNSTIKKLSSSPDPSGREMLSTARPSSRPTLLRATRTAHMQSQVSSIHTRLSSSRRTNQMLIEMHTC